MEVSPKNLQNKKIETRDFMSHMVARTMKLKAGNLGGLGRHVERTTDNHSNKDIDPEKSHLNYELVQRNNSIQSEITSFIESEKSTTRKLRKDAVLCNEWIISSDKFFFEKLSAEETRNYFEVAKDYFAENFGEKNIRYAVVHMDESTPHMHLGIVPFDKENKLSAKRMFDRKTLIKIQDELPERFKHEGFDIERGKKDSKRKHLSVPDYKEFQREKETLQQEINALEVGRSTLERKIDGLEEDLNQKASELDQVHVKRLEVIDEVKDLSQQKHALKSEISPLIARNNDLEEKLSKNKEILLKQKNEWNKHKQWQQRMKIQSERGNELQKINTLPHYTYEKRMGGLTTEKVQSKDKVVVSKYEVDSVNEVLNRAHKAHTIADFQLQKEREEREKIEKELEQEKENSSYWHEAWNELNDKIEQTLKPALKQLTRFKVWAFEKFEGAGHEKEQIRERFENDMKETDQRAKERDRLRRNNWGIER